MVAVLLVASAGELTTHNLMVLLGLAGLGFVGVVVMPAITSSLAYAVVLAPPMLALAYVWLSIRAARLTLKLGSAWLRNALVVYLFASSAFFTAASFPVLKDWLGLPAICG